MLDFPDATTFPYALLRTREMLKKRQNKCLRCHFHIHEEKNIWRGKGKFFDIYVTYISFRMFMKHVETHKGIKNCYKHINSSLELQISLSFYGTFPFPRYPSLFFFLRMKCREHYLSILLSWKWHILCAHNLS